jgi:hypothetical protein
VADASRGVPDNPVIMRVHDYKTRVAYVAGITDSLTQHNPVLNIVQRPEGLSLLSRMIWRRTWIFCIPCNLTSTPHNFRTTCARNKVHIHVDFTQSQ